MTLPFVLSLPCVPSSVLGMETYKNWFISPHHCFSQLGRLHDRFQWLAQAFPVRRVKGFCLRVNGKGSAWREGSRMETLEEEEGVLKGRAGL